MPPKTKTKKSRKKKSAAVGARPKDEMSKAQLAEHIVRLREELDREREERNYFQLERDKIRAFWEISKRSLEESEAELRRRQREREEADERHRVEITVYKQKLKHVLSEHQNMVAELKIDSVAASSLIQTQHREAELELRKNIQGQQAEIREKECYNQNCLEELQLKQQVELMDLANSYERTIRDIEARYHKNMHLKIEAEGKKRRLEINELEDRMKSHIVTLLENHDRALQGAEEFYSASQKKLLEDQKLLKEELAEATRLQVQADKELSAAHQENRRLDQTLQEAKQKLPKLQEQLEEHKKAKAKMATSRARVKVIEKELRDLKVEHELLLQAFQTVQQERDELLKKQMEAIMDVQQKSGLKELVLDRKLAALTDTVEKREAQLCALLSTVDQTEGSSAANKLKDILESKQTDIDELQCDLARDCKEYDKLLQTCEERLADLGVPLQDFPFRSSGQILDGRTRVKTSSRPASRR